MSDQHAVVDESVMSGHGFYSANSRPQHVAAAVAYPYLSAAAEAVPISSAPATITDLGCASGPNEMEPMALAVDALCQRAPPRAGIASWTSGRESWSTGASSSSWLARPQAG